jgi:ABC-type multidrug transport system ATPase subunit
MEFYSSFYDRPADWERLLDDLGLADKRDTSYGKLSGGQKQRLSIALALVGNPELAILDELTTGLDPNARRDTWELIEQIRDRGVTVVPVTHLMEEAERLADRVALIDHGRLVAIDSPDGLVSRIDTEQRIRWCPGQRSQVIGAWVGVEEYRPIRAVHLARIRPTARVIRAAAMSTAPAAVTKVPTERCPGWPCHRWRKKPPDWLRIPTSSRPPATHWTPRE